MKNAPDSPDSPERPAAGSGARNDDSSLFSLASLKLTQAARPKTAEDSGLIDLNALGVIEKGAEPGAPAPRTPLAVAPVVAPNDIFGSAGTPMLIAPSAAAVATAAPGAQAQPARGKGLVMIGGAVAVVGLAVGVFLATRGGGDAPAIKPIATATAAPPPTTTAPPAATTVAAPEPTIAAVTPGQRAAVEPTATATATAAAPVAKVPGPLPVAKAPGGGGGKAPGPAKADPPPKPVETCDLACQMQRAVQKK